VYQNEKHTNHIFPLHLFTSTTIISDAFGIQKIGHHNENASLSFGRFSSSLQRH